MQEEYEEEDFDNNPFRTTYFFGPFEEIHERKIKESSESTPTPSLGPTGNLTPSQGPTGDLTPTGSVYNPAPTSSFIVPTGLGPIRANPSPTSSFVIQ